MKRIVIDEKLYKILIQPSINFNFYQVSSQCKNFRDVLTHIRKSFTKKSPIEIKIQYHLNPQEL